MRTAIFFGLVLIAQAINLEVAFGIFETVLLIVFIVMDVIDFAQGYEPDSKS